MRVPSSLVPLLSAICLGVLIVPSFTLAQPTFPAGNSVEQFVDETEQLNSTFQLESSPEFPISGEFQKEHQLQRFRRGFYQKSEYSSFSMGNRNADNFQWLHADASVSVAIPLGSFENILVATPKFEIDSLSGPENLDVPNNLYGAGVGFFFRKKFNPVWSMLLSARPMMLSDFEASNGFRISGMALASYEWKPEVLTLMFGVVVLNRNDIPILPGVGLVWKPSPDCRVDLIFPRPRISYRLNYICCEQETWMYLAGKLGGKTWGVQRADGTEDELTARDYQLLLGIERIGNYGKGFFAEAGFVFGRTLEFESDQVEIDMKSTLMLRSGLRF